NFWRWVIYGVVAVIVFVAIIFLWREVKFRISQRHFNKILDNLKRVGQEEYLKNFINRFGFENKRSGGWSFRNRRFDWDRINDLKKILKEAGVTSNEKDVFALLRFYIQENEEKLTRESIRKEPQKFTILSGAEFEKLLYRLFEAMGYKVELTGKSGDQGGDLIANKQGERILVQAKCYRDWSAGNAAVQQVVGAMRYYDCNKAIVVTTSHFTNEAITLAKANKVELISRERLQELLLQFLGESWV
ncbi:MAG: restriction endonuclease, partial [bacterium]|nr:restriction endonuclease [bacterium]